MSRQNTQKHKRPGAKPLQPGPNMTDRFNPSEDSPAVPPRTRKRSKVTGEKKKAPPVEENSAIPCCVTADALNL